MRVELEVADLADLLRLAVLDMLEPHGDRVSRDGEQVMVPRRRLREDEDARHVLRHGTEPELFQPLHELRLRFLVKERVDLIPFGFELFE